MMRRLNLSEPADVFREILVNYELFAIGTGNMRGEPVNGHPSDTGDLPEPYLSQLKNSKPDYVVFSYETPIAWHDATSGTWFVPDVTYSLATTQHQWTVKGALTEFESGRHISLRIGHGAAGLYGPGWQGSL